MKKGFSKTFLNTALYIGISMILLVISLSVVLKVIVEKEGLEAMRESNEVLLSEIGYHVSYMHSVNLALCRMEFSDSNSQELLISGGKVDIFSANNIINRIKKSMVVNGMVDSVMLYNGIRNEFYCTDPYLNRLDEEMKELLRTDRGEKTVFIIPRELNLPDKNHVLSYVMLSRFSKDHSIESAVVVNVSTNWMLSNLATEEAAGAELLLVAKSGDVILDTKGTAGEYNLDDNMFTHITEGNGESFIQELDGEKRVVSYQAVAGTEWYLVNSQPYDTLYAMVNAIRVKMIWAVFLSLIAALVVTVLAARLITRPIINLTNKIQDSFGEVPVNSQAGNSRFKEVDFLMDVFENQQKAISRYKDYKEGAEDALYKQYLKNTLLENDTGIASFNSQTGKSGKMVADEKIYMVLLAISSFQNLSEDDVTERNLIRFSVCNIAHEIMEQYGRIEVLPMSGGEVILLLGREEHDEALCRSLLNEVTENIRNILTITVSVFVEKLPYSRHGLATGYKHLRAMSRYTLIYGVNCILFEAEINQQSKNALKYPQELERDLLSGMSGGDEEKIENAIHEFLQYLGEGSIESFQACVHKLILSMQEYVGKMNQNRLIKIQGDFEGMLARLKGAETSEQVYQMLLGAAQGVVAQMPTSTVQKNTTLVTGVKQYIHDHYSSKDLCGKKVAGEFGLSTAYLGMLFKDVEECGIQEYINNVRLEHAKQMVLDTDLLISEIMELCGFETSSFYRLYKVRFGVSPKEQRMQNRLMDNDR